jgi:hypothetical protein
MAEEQEQEQERGRATGTVTTPVVSAEQREFFSSQGYVVLRSLLLPARKEPEEHEEEHGEDKEKHGEHGEEGRGGLQALQRRTRLYAPDPSLRRQYAQEDDCKRFEFSLSHAPPAEVLAKRKLSELKAEGASGGEGEGEEDKEDEEGGPFQLPVLSAVVSELCAELKPAEAFCIVSEPGSRAQVPHTDSIPMEGQSDESWQSTLHYIGLLVPLQDTNEQCGQTAVIPTSHLNPYATTEVKVSMKLGDVLVMDGRTTHRGLANLERPNEADNKVTNGDASGSTCTSTSDDAKSHAPSPRKICFFTFTLPDITDGNALAYAEHEAEEALKKKVKI